MIIGHTAEIYVGGTSAWPNALLSFTIALSIVAWLFVPWFYRLNPTSVNKVLELRFGGRLVSTWGAVLSILLQGGLKAVIWTDVFQSVTMLAGVLTILIKGLIIVGGFSEAFRLVGEVNRLTLFNCCHCLSRTFLRALPDLADFSWPLCTAEHSVVVYGLLSIGFAFVVKEMPGPITQVSISVAGAMFGPVLAIFLISGIRLFSWCNSQVSVNIEPNPCCIGVLVYWI
ncbi:hypothetical protein LSH36_1168g00060 [Paralvinella palmiformis]|uniref:Uncharacterized protein n=1 Tax=Paralvinella palmiformis TaxID=53620 RepID=A0AAD9IUS5_9ANNE|nr:hypothetical protein LSH36_1168g00060 [Paralvinella palmiformis]